MLTPQQLSTLKAAILADGFLGPLWVATDDHVTVADAFNLPASPAYFVWRTVVSINEIMSNGFDWTRVDNMTVGEARIWEYMTQLGELNPSRANVRAGVNEAYKGTAQDNAMRLAIYGHCQRLASRFEQLFATGAGTTATDVGAGPGTMTVEGPLSPFDVQQAKGAA